MGFIADDVHAALANSGWSNIVGSKSVNDVDYLTLDYSRLVSVLLPAVSELTKQINELKSQLHTNEAWVS